MCVRLKAADPLALMESTGQDEAGALQKLEGHIFRGAIRSWIATRNGAFFCKNSSFNAELTDYHFRFQNR